MSASGVEVVAIGEPLIAFVSHAIGVSLADSVGFGMHVVGAELNGAVGLARLGHRVAFVGRVGRDPFGLAIRRQLGMEGVETKWLFDDNRPTGFLFRNLRVVPPSEVLYHRAGSAGSTLSLSEVELALDNLDAGGFVLLSGVTAAVCRGLVSELGNVVKRRGLRLVLDLNYRTRLWSRDEASVTLTALARRAYLVTGTVEEAQLVTGVDDVVASAAALVRQGPEIVVLRHDVVKATFCSHDRSELITVSGRELPAVDPVGAGDAFVAGLVSGILELSPPDPHAWLTRAHDCGAAVIGTVGDIEGALRREEVGREMFGTLLR